MPPLEPLLAEVRARSTGIVSRIHGEVHWRTVGANGLWLAEPLDGADRHVIFLFALLHDSMRVNDSIDPEHGPRAAAFAAELHAEGMLPITTTQLELLQHACSEHANGFISTDPTVGACWDADRLDLPRVWITPDPTLLSTERARNGAAVKAEPPPWSVLYAADRRVTSRRSTILRRLRTVPLFLLLFVVTTVALPFLLAVAVVVDAVRWLVRRRPWMATRLALFLWVYLAAEALAIVALGLAWAVPPRSRLVERTYRLQALWAALLFGAARRLFSLRFDVEGADAVAPGPIVVLMRHASIVDNLLPALFVAAPHGLRLRYVLKRELLSDPAIDIAGGRLPNCFVRRGADDAEAEIARVRALAAGLGPRRGRPHLPRGDALHGREARARDRAAAAGGRAPERAAAATGRYARRHGDAAPTSSSAPTTASTASPASATSGAAGSSAGRCGSASIASPAPRCRRAARGGRTGSGSAGTRSTTGSAPRKRRRERRRDPAPRRGRDRRADARALARQPAPARRVDRRSLLGARLRDRRLDGRARRRTLRLGPRARAADDRVGAAALRSPRAAQPRARRGLPLPVDAEALPALRADEPRDRVRAAGAA